MEQVGIIGGTGPLGRGLAARFAQAGHVVVVGSRSEDRARGIVDELRRGLHDEADIQPAVNEEAVSSADIIVVAVPYDGQEPALRGLQGAGGGKIVVNVVNPLGFDAVGPHVLELEHGSAAEECQRLWPDARVVAAFKSVPASRLLAVDEPVGCDTFIAGDDAAAVERVAQIASSFPGMNGVICGTLRNARFLETLTPLLISVNRRYDAHSALRVVGLPAES